MSPITQPLKINNNEIVRLKLKIERLKTQLAIIQYLNSKLKKIIFELIDKTFADPSKQANIDRRSEDSINSHDSH